MTRTARHYQNSENVLETLFESVPSRKLLWLPDLGTLLVRSISGMCSQWSNLVRLNSTAQSELNGLQMVKPSWLPFCIHVSKSTIWWRFSMQVELNSFKRLLSLKNFNMLPSNHVKRERISLHPLQKWNTNHPWLESRNSQSVFLPTEVVVVRLLKQCVRRWAEPRTKGHKNLIKPNRRITRTLVRSKLKKRQSTGRLLLARLKKSVLKVQLRSKNSSHLVTGEKVTLVRQLSWRHLRSSKISNSSRQISHSSSHTASRTLTKVKRSETTTSSVNTRNQSFSLTMLTIALNSTRHLRWIRPITMVMASLSHRRSSTIFLLMRKSRGARGKAARRRSY